MSNIDFTHPRFKDITGFQSGRLTALWPVERNSFRQTVWECVCECGKLSRMVGNNLTSGHIQSCGCLGTERRAASTTTHGMSGSKVYKTWKGMWDRCSNPKAVGYQLYKDRAPPPEWRDFLTFYAEMGDPPAAEDISIDRIDNDKPYGPGNCRWATRTVQNRNRGDNRIVEVGGKLMALAQACEESGKSYGRIYARITKLGWSAEEAFNTAKISTTESNRQRAA